jgi:nucleotide-binding universal stress UspA family protein
LLQELPVRTAIRSILAYLPAATIVDRTLDVAMPLAKRSGAHLTGLHVLPHPPIYADPGMGMSAEIYMAQQAALEEDAKRIGEAYAARLGDAAGDWVTVPDPRRPIMHSGLDFCRTADLVVAPQFDPSMPGAHAYFPEDLIMGGGRPILLVPYAGHFSVVGRRVLIAWNNRREAARAAFDALPLLDDAAEITLLLVAQEGELGQVLADSAARLVETLGRHGLKAKVQTSHTVEVAVGDEILSRAADLGSDLIVMGCYGHSRLRETVFGGATRSILEQMTVPVLMAH